MKPFMQDARAHQCHQHLIVGDARAFIHRVQAVQQAHDSLLIEKRDRGQNRAASVSCTKTLSRLSGLRVAGGLRNGCFCLR